MRILISNDDGIESPGIHALAEVMKDLGEVIVVAPHRERSTAGHSLTLHKPLRLVELKKNFFAVTGTPADCVYMGVHAVLAGTKPDFILSGINAGANLGTDVHYSGTVAAAREGALLNIPSYAFSLVQHAQGGDLRFDAAAKWARRVFEGTRHAVFPKHTLLNVNVPNLPEGEVRAWEIARQGFRYYSNDVMKRKDPRGRDYYWIGGPYKGFEATEASDCDVVQKGSVSVTPLTIDCTHNEFYTTLQHRVVPSGVS